MLPKADSGGFVLLLFILTTTDPPRTGNVKGVALFNAFAEMVFAAVWAGNVEDSHFNIRQSRAGRQGL